MNNVKSLKRTLLIIEGLYLLYQDCSKSKKNAEERLDTIYRMAHIHGKCKAPHIDWRKEREKICKALTKHGII